MVEAQSLNRYGLKILCVCFFNLEIDFSPSSSKQPLYLILKLGNEVE